jgi:hypothetical protein
MQRASRRDSRRQLQSTITGLAAQVPAVSTPLNPFAGIAPPQVQQQAPQLQQQQQHDPQLQEQQQQQQHDPQLQEQGSELQEESPQEQQGLPTGSQVADPVASALQQVGSNCSSSFLQAAYVHIS